ncbi:hypothetical protein C8R43DRAFT_946758 [Mycena crocata]|nr:hypothetical protein C8R43DRAFT_946758 [Mycena crocata]
MDTKDTFKPRKLFSSFRRTKSPPTEHVSQTKGFDLPYDILLQIITHWHLPESHVLKLCLLIQSLTMQHSREASSTYCSQHFTPAHIRRLTVRPNHPPRRGTDKPVDESWVASQLEQLAASGHLQNLHAFIWDGLESPPDSLWLVLRLSCPHLKIVGTAVGLTTQRLDPESHLFDFRDLVGKPNLTNAVSDLHTFTSRIFSRNSKVLTLDHPNLVELTIDGTCIVSQLWNIRKIFTGRWPLLRSLSLGNVSSRSLETDSVEGSVFLKAHPRLEHVAFFGSLSGYTNGISSLPLVPLPRLFTFTGKINQLKDATGTQFSVLRSLRLSDYFSPAAKFAPILPNFPSVISLAVCVNFLDTVNGSHRGFFKRLLSSCPQLTHIEVSSTASFTMEHFSEAIQHTPHLRTFILTLPRKRRLADQPNSMRKFALRTAKRFPSLEEFTIRDVADWDHEDQLNNNFRLLNLSVYHVLASGSSRLLRGEESGFGPLERHVNCVTRHIPI